MTEVSRHFAVYQSPGTFFAEGTQRPVESWDVEEARANAPKNAFAFHFITRARGPDDLDSKVVAESNRYFLGGQIFTQLQIATMGDKSLEILARNMKSGDIERAIRTPFGNWQAFGEKDVLLCE